MEYINIITHIILIMSLGWYLITNLQWYNYKLERVVLKHHKWQWHITYFVAPVLLFYIIPESYYAIYFYLLYMTSFVLWNRKLDRPLVLTSRVKRFLVVLLVVTFSMIALCLSSPTCTNILIFIPLILAYGISMIMEKIFFISFKHKGKQRFQSIAGLKTVAITASFGKTSIKNYLHHVLKNKYKV